MLRQMMPYFLQDCSVPEPMLDEVLVSAGERCVQPEGMEASAVLALVYQAQGGLKLKSNEGGGGGEW